MPPENIRVGAFVFGAILILISILGGNFKLFGAEVATTTSNRFLRFLAFALGTVFLIIAMYPPDFEARNPIISPSPQATISGHSPIISLSPSPLSSAQRLAKDLDLVNIDFSDERLRNELDNLYSKYPQFANGCLNLLKNQRLKKKTYFDVIISDYQDMGGLIAFDSPDGNLDPKILKDAIVKAYLIRNGGNASYFEEIVELKK